MNGEIDFQGLLRGSIVDSGGGGGSTVEITPIVTSGTKIADVSINGVEKDLYCPTPPTPQEVVITPVVTSGTKIADVSINGVEKDLYCSTPTEVEVTPIQTSGTKIASVNVDGISTDIYAPNSSGIIYSTDERTVGTWVDGKTLYQKTLVIHNETDVNSNRTIANISNDYQVKYFKAIAIESGITYYLPYVSSSGNASIYFRDTGAVVFNIINSSFSAGSDFYITYVYTKVSEVSNE